MKGAVLMWRSAPLCALSMVLSIPVAAHADPPSKLRPVAGLGASARRGEGSVRAVAEVKGPVTLRLETLSAGVEVETGSPGQVVVTVDDGDVSSVRLVPRGTDRVEAEFDGRQRLLRGQAHVKLPPGSSLDVGTISGGLAVKGLGGDARVRSTSGDIDIAGAARADVRTISGDAAVRDVRGEVRVRTVSGDVAVTCPAGQVGPRLEFESTSGGLEWTGVCGRGCHLEARSSSGDVRMNVGDKSSFELRYSSHSGDLTDDVKLVGLQRRDAPIGGGQSSGRLGEGEGLIECSTFSGDLQLRRR